MVSSSAAGPYRSVVRVRCNMSIDWMVVNVRVAACFGLALLVFPGALQAQCGGGGGSCGGHGGGHGSGHGSGLSATHVGGGHTIGGHAAGRTIGNGRTWGGNHLGDAHKSFYGTPRLSGSPGNSHGFHPATATGLSNFVDNRAFASSLTRSMGWAQSTRWSSPINGGMSSSNLMDGYGQQMAGRNINSYFTRQPLSLNQHYGHDSLADWRSRALENEASKGDGADGLSSFSGIENTDWDSVLRETILRSAYRLPPRLSKPMSLTEPGTARPQQSPTLRVLSEARGAWCGQKAPIGSNVPTISATSAPAGLTDGSAAKAQADHVHGSKP